MKTTEQVIKVEDRLMDDMLTNVRVLLGSKREDARSRRSNINTANRIMDEIERILNSRKELA